MSELVTCPVCGKESSVKLAGTIPRNWCAKYLAPGDMPRFCGEPCLRVAWPIARF